MPLHLIPGFKQSPSFCGPASLQMILHHYGIEATEEDIGRVAKTTIEHGTTNENLLIAAQHYGLDGAWQHNGTVDMIRSFVEQDIPVIVEWFSSDESPDPGEVHYSIIVGVSDTHVFLLDPEDGEKHEISHIKFMSVWFSFSGPYPNDPTDVRIRWFLPLTKR